MLEQAATHMLDSMTTYGLKVGHLANDVAHDTVEDPKFAVTIKPDGSPRSTLDENLDVLACNALQACFPEAVAQSEEQVAAEPPTLVLGRQVGHIDSLDGTKNFLQGRDLWLEKERKGRLLSGAIMSIGVMSAVESVEECPSPEFAIMAAPFLPDGASTWVARQGQLPILQDAHGVVRFMKPLPEAAEGRPTVMLTKNSANYYREALARVGLGVGVYSAGVANGMMALQPEFFHQWSPGLEGKINVVGTIMKNGQNWDLAGLHVLASSLGASVTRLDGSPMRYHPGDQGGIVAVNPDALDRIQTAVKKTMI